jgi:glycosyltransferase involved in cell wall biosynthesis
MKVVAYTRYGTLGASSRVRLMQYIEPLARVGIDVQVQPLLGDDYLRAKYRDGRTPLSKVMAPYARRAGALLGGGNGADVVWIEKELWPWAPAWLERGMLAGRKVVLDYDDAIFHQYDLHPRPWVRRVWGRKIDRLMKAATLVTAGNDYLASRARSAGATRVELLPTVIDLERYRIAPCRERGPFTADGPFTVGWIGSPSTVHYLEMLADPLSRLAQRVPLQLRVIGAQPRLDGVPIVPVPWTEDTEVAAIAACDVGVMPLPDSPWERGKCGYKLIQYMACGLPVVGSPVGVNSTLVSEGLNGFLAADDDAWEQALHTLATDAPLRARMGEAGRRRAAEHYSLQANAPRLAGWLQQLAQGRTAPSQGRH